MARMYVYLFLGLGFGTFFGTESKLFASPVMEPTLTRSQRAISSIDQSEAAKSQPKNFDKDAILKDHKNKISADFKVPADFQARVSFWFDIYTKYGAQTEVIHYADYPWIVYKVIDLSSIYNGKGHKWTKYHAAKKYSKTQRDAVRNTIKKLANRKNYKKLSKEEKRIYDLLASVPGKRKKVFKDALKGIRAQLGQRDFIEQGLETSALYMPELERLFTERGLPVELTRLPFVESSFNVKAVSKVGASGIWQVMPYVGKKLLLMNQAVDERNSPIKAADSAITILKQNKKILKNWPLALTAYNHGVGSLRKAVRQYKTHDLGRIIMRNRAKSFGFASQNFFASFIAALHAEMYKEDIYNTPKQPNPLEFQELKLTQSLTIKTLMKYTGLSKDGLQKYNLDIKDDAFKKNLRVPKGYVVHIPSTMVTEFLAKNKNQKYGKLVERPSTSSL